MNVNELPFHEIWALDFEYFAPPGERPKPICLVARELRSGRELRLVASELHAMPSAPFSPGALLVAYYASAELGCFLSLGWSTTFRILDLYVEFRVLTNGASTPCGSGLLGALVYFGLAAMTAVDKDSMRELAQRGEPFSSEEESALVRYCTQDVDALVRLLPFLLAGMTPDEFQRALLRGSYMRAAAAMEHNGVPLDVPLVAELAQKWDRLKTALVDDLGTIYEGVFVEGKFREVGWQAYLARHGIPWLTTESGRLKLDDDTFKDLGRMHPQVETMRQLRHSLSQLRLHDLAVGGDGRNRLILSAFRSRTGRNQPSNSRFIFGPAVWMRSLIRAEPGYALAYIDWEQQEFGIGAYLSGDPNMIAAYESDDCYLKFAELAGAVPPGATKTSHPVQRERFKVCALAVQYGMGPGSLAIKLRISPMEAMELLRKHRETFRVYWSWSDGALHYALLFKRLHTVFGWNLQVGPDANDRSLRNFPVQANGAEMLRLACILAIDAGLELSAPVHDALLLHAPLHRVTEDVAAAQEQMAVASSLVLGGPRLRTDAKIFRFPERYADPRGEAMWETVMRLLEGTRA